MTADTQNLQSPVLAFDANLSGDKLIDEALTTVREHFGMPVAYLSRFEGDSTIFRNVSAPGLEGMIKPFDQRKLTEVYCPHILKGDLPNLIPDTALEPICQSMPITADVPIGSHVSLPILLDDGTPYGMFCCLSPDPNPTLNDRDVTVMATFVALVTRQVRQEEHQRLLAVESQAWIEEVLSGSSFKPVFQPIVRLSDRACVGLEALSRFDSEDGIGTEEVFQKAEEAGLGLDLEMVTMVKALAEYDAIRPPVYMALNASPGLICDPRFADILPATDLDWLVIEITEHSQAEDEDVLSTRIADWHGAGARVAIDDVGAGYSGLLRIAKLQPDLLKIDRSLVTGLADSAAQRAIVSALVHLARQTGCQLLGEGVETEADASALKALGVDLAQGWLYGRPKPLDAYEFSEQSRTA